MGGKGSSGYHRRHMRIEDLSQPTATPFRRLDTISGLVVDLRYATANNFDGRVLYREWDCAWLRQEACAGLELAVGWLARERPGWRLVVLDALRPQRVQDHLRHRRGELLAVGHVQELVRPVRVALRAQHAADHHLRGGKALLQHGSSAGWCRPGRCSPPARRSARWTRRPAPA
jgi:D-alanyl-D-alanine dipeptidase